MHTMKKALLLSLAVAGFALAADSARACTYACVNVGPGFCMRCEDVGYWTGGGCRDSGACGCYDVQEICFNSVALSSLTESAAQFTSVDAAATSPAAAASTPADSAHE